MSTEALYQELILEHNRKPRNFREMTNADRTIEGRNPLCGDSLTLWVKLENDAIADVSFKGQGCAISKASASLMTAAVKGKTRAEAEDLFERFHRLVTGTLPESEHQSLGSLRALGGVSRFPLRVKCASLAWHALHTALGSNETEVSTEREGPESPPLEGA
ncbi:MAG TPA: SUF system NifU family Fe-S cluster assembly protein [Gemmatimonadaceae bacterium]|jgi:nitrogen fixation NifU-like protein|nr:SUF system NifU family Fe-S cluster assembly protein [Gemmatimonadaceae bacterium]